MKQIDKIIKGCLKNDRKSQFELYDYCFDTIMNICLRYERDRDAAMDLLNQAFVKVLKNLGSFCQDYELLPWVRRITVNVAIDHCRKKSRERQFINDSSEPLLYEEAPPGNFTDDWVETEYLEHLLTCLKDSEKLVFNLFAIDGFSHKEIAEHLGITERSSIRHLTNARRKLQYHMSLTEPGTKKA